MRQVCGYLAVAGDGATELAAGVIDVLAGILSDIF